MADAVDMAAQIEAEHVSRGLALATVPVPLGVPGECEGCDWWMPRLVNGLCGFCRDRRPRPADWEPPTPPQSVAPTQPLTRPEDPVMPAKTISLPASAATAIACLEAHAASMDLPLGAAAADLIERGADTVRVGSPAPIELDQIGIHALVAEICRRVDEQDRAPDLTDELAAVTARAEAAEGRLAQMKALFA